MRVEYGRAIGWNGDRLDEDQARGNAARRAREATTLAHHADEAVLVRHAEQRAIATVAPGVVRAHERLLRIAARRTLDARAAMPADVEECGNLAIIVAHDQ